MSWRKIALVILVVLSACGSSEPYEPQNGDIIFHTSRSAQSVAIQRATNSQYSHMGIVFLKEGKAFVFEAVEPVKSTPLNEWIARGVKSRFVVKRLRNADQVLTAAALARMQEEGERFRERHYDIYFEWTDDRVYCSELVWKIYERATGIEIGNLQEIGDFDLTDRLVRKKVWERWSGAPPPDETVISPETIFGSDLLITAAD